MGSKIKGIQIEDGTISDDKLIDSAENLKRNGSVPFTSNLNADSNTISNLKDATEQQEPVTYKQVVDDAISNAKLIDGIEVDGSLIGNDKFLVFKSASNKLEYVLISNNALSIKGKDIDDSSIGDGKILKFNGSSDKMEYVDENNDALTIDGIEVDGTNLGDKRILSFIGASGKLEYIVENKDAESIAGKLVDDTNIADQKVLGYSSVSGKVEYITMAGGSSSPGGSDTQIQFNDGGAFAGSPDLTFDKNTKQLNVANIINTNEQYNINDKLAFYHGNLTNDSVLIGGAGPSDLATMTGVKNNAIGTLSLSSLTSGDYNTSWGFESLKFLTTGSFNLALGYGSGKYVNGDFNTYLGTSSSNRSWSSTQSNSVAIGYDSGNGVSGDYNTSIGSQAAGAITGSECTGGYNTLIGYRTAYEIAGAASRNIIIGAVCGYKLTSSNNILLGGNTGNGITTGGDNICLGSYVAEQGIVDGIDNIIMGKNSARNMSGGSGNIMFGTSVGLNINANNNILMGMSVAPNLDEGNSNIFVGDRCGRYAQGTSNNNIVFGGYALSCVNGGYKNIVAGYLSGYNVSTGHNNIFLGTETGKAFTTQYSSIMIGNSIGKSALAPQSNMLAIDVSDRSDPLIYGKFDSRFIKINGRLRITDNSEVAVAGDLRYNSSINKHQGYDGTQWNDLY